MINIFVNQKDTIKEERPNFEMIIKHTIFFGNSIVIYHMLEIKDY